MIISGRVSEFFNLTQLSSASLVEVIRHDVDQAAETPPFVVDPPADNDAANRYWERREGMQAKRPGGSSLVQGGRSVFPSTADAEIYVLPRRRRTRSHDRARSVCPACLPRSASAR